jgi:hypothetical protein
MGLTPDLDEVLDEDEDYDDDPDEVAFEEDFVFA